MANSLIERRFAPFQPTPAFEISTYDNRSKPPAILRNEECSNLAFRSSPIKCSQMPMESDRIIPNSPNLQSHRQNIAHDRSNTLELSETQDPLRLNLMDTQVTTAGVQDLQKALSNCGIHH